MKMAHGETKSGRGIPSWLSTHLETKDLSELMLDDCSALKRKEDTLTEIIVYVTFGAIGGYFPCAIAYFIKQV